MLGTQQGVTTRTHTRTLPPLPHIAPHKRVSDRSLVRDVWAWMGGCRQRRQQQYYLARNKPSHHFSYLARACSLLHQDAFPLPIMPHAPLSAAHA